VRRILSHLDMPTEAPPFSRARDPTDDLDDDQARPSSASTSPEPSRPPDGQRAGVSVRVSAAREGGIRVIRIYGIGLRCSRAP
jgi:hypothetical protein